MRLDPILRKEMIFEKSGTLARPHFTTRSHLYKIKYFIMFAVKL